MKRLWNKYGGLFCLCSFFFFTGMTRTVADMGVPLFFIVMGMLWLVMRDRRNRAIKKIEKEAGNG